jgi:uncharacterized RDD family membrane protein YckC
MHSRGLLGQYAGFASRAVAFVLDVLIIIVLVLITYWMIRLPLSFLLGATLNECMGEQVTGILSGPLLCRIGEAIWFGMSLLAAPVYFVFFHSATGQTVGKAVLGLRVVRLDGRRFSVWGAFVRWIGLFLSAIPFGLGLFWVGIDDRRQGWHDKMVATCVVYSWEAEQNEFFLDRLRRTLQKQMTARQLTQRVSFSRKNYDLIMIAFPEYDRLEKVLDQVQDVVTEGQVHIVNATVVVKGAGGNISVMGTAEIAENRPRRFVEGVVGIPDQELVRATADAPNDSFVVAIMLEDPWADLLAKSITRSGTVLIRRYDLGDAVATGHGTGAHPVN